MGQEYLSTPIVEVASTGCICEADVQRLRRDVFRDGSLSERQAEALCFLNKRCKVCCKEWRAFFSEAVGDYIVHLAAPSGKLSLDNADWLIERVASQGSIGTAAGISLLVCCLEAASEAPEELLEFALAEARRAVIYRGGPLVTNPAGRAGLNKDEASALTLRLIKALVRHGALSVDSVDVTDLDAGWRALGHEEPLVQVIAQAA